MHQMDPAQVIDRFFNEVWNERQFGVLSEIIDPTCVTHQVRSASGEISSAARGPAALREHIESWITAFPDIVVAIDLQCVSPPYVVTWVTMRGRHTGQWQGVPPTGREVTIRSVAQHHVEGGRIVEDWVIVETLGLFQQLGLVAPTAELLKQS
jgi:predicted ester cyclase